MRGIILIVLIVAGIYLLLHYVHTKRVVEEAQGGIKGLRRTATVSVRNDLRVMADEIQSWTLSHGELPSSLEEVFGRVPRDPWGHPIMYRKEGEGFVLISKGPDGLEGTQDDISLRR